VSRAPRPPRFPRDGAPRPRDDRGGVWIVTGLVLGAVVYAGMVLMVVAGVTAVVPLVVIPPVLVALIAANSLLGGGRSHGRSPGRPVGQGRAPLSSRGANGAVPTDPSTPDGSAVGGEPSGLP
jgi:hypothetical protein